MRSIANPRAGKIAGALCFTTLTAAATPAAADAAAPSFRLSESRLSYGERVVATGAVDRALAGRRVSLELRSGASGAWKEIAARPAGVGGRYRVRAVVPRSGALRVRVAGSPELSAKRAVRVAAALRVSHRTLDLPAGRRARVAGTVRPRIAGHVVRLQVRRGSRWSTIDSARTRKGGRFALSDRLRSTMSAAARVQVDGAGVTGAGRSLGRLNVYRRAYASWYGPGLYGNTLGCGGRLGAGTLGVAHKTLPCGTSVTFRKGSRTVRVRVIDRGPYVGGREYDLTAATAQRLGFRGHGPVLATR